MTVKTQPKAWSSVGGAVCFELADVDYPHKQAKVAIESPAQPSVPLGVKAMYPAEDRSLVVNVAPYLRSLLDPQPILDKSTGATLAAFRTAPVRLAVTPLSLQLAYNTPYVNLAAGRENLEVNTILSAGPERVVVAPTDRDEFSLVTTAIVQPTLVFKHGNTTYTDSSMNTILAKEMIAMVVDVPDCIRRAATKAGIEEDEVDAFTIRLKLSTSGGNVYLEKFYTVDRRPSRGVRLAWINRFGAIDYHTFPVVESTRSRGTNVGTPAARCEEETRLISEPCDENRAGWLAEILSSPNVWKMEGTTKTSLKIADGEILTSPLKPTYITLAVTPKA